MIFTCFVLMCSPPFPKPDADSSKALPLKTASCLCSTCSTTVPHNSARKINTSRPMLDRQLLILSPCRMISSMIGSNVEKLMMPKSLLTTGARTW
ncbi:Uncharacterized protein TCM_011768 [Theobroma cacao]|uniref:Uncharacterized protein n=1 Tax=Theobroma cacao TaxID=3641 RepID=A0A061EI68_THECC|nr:Uncharacterized protein TCM_011768 [Theobroma cacao]